MRIKGLGLACAGVIAAGALVPATLAAGALTWPTSGLGRAVGLFQVHEARANAALQAARSPDPTVSNGALAVAARETRRSLRESAANPTPWLRLAYLDSLDEDGLSDAGRRYLARSYTIAPLGPDDSRWRLRFALDHWEAIGPDLRRHARSELATHRANGRASVDGLAEDVVDPAGRLAAALEASR